MRTRRKRKKSLKGERLQWFRLASHLGLPLQELQDRTSSTEFVQWQAFLEMEVNDFHREDYYLAQIAAEIRRTKVRNPNKVSVDAFLLKFKAAHPDTKDPVDPAHRKKAVEASKRAWLGRLGVRRRKA